jgi:hypothetical protein
MQLVLQVNKTLVAILVKRHISKDSSDSMWPNQLRLEI